MAKATKAVSRGVSALIVIALIITVGFGLFLNATFNTSSTTNTSNTIGTTSISSSSSNSSTTTVSVQNVSLSDYNAPAVYGTTQANGTVLYIPPTTEGNLGFQVVMPEAIASTYPTISVYLNGRSITGCMGVITIPIQGMQTEGLGCSPPVTPVGSSNNVTILVSSPLIATSGIYKYESMVVTTNSSSSSTSSTSFATTTSQTTSSSLTSNTTTQTNTLPAACSGSLAFGGSLAPKANSSATLCVEFYYYGSQAKTFSPIGQLSITGFPSSGSAFDASSNFTVTSSVSNLTIGGPSNENEGSLVIYTITPKANSSGTYLLNLGWVLVPPPTNVLDCGMEFLLISGNGNPSYTNLTSLCITMTSIGTLPYPYYTGTLFAKVVGAANSTTPSG